MKRDPNCCVGPWAEALKVSAPPHTSGPNGQESLAQLPSFRAGKSCPLRAPSAPLGLGAGLRGWICVRWWSTEADGTCLPMLPLGFLLVSHCPRWANAGTASHKMLYSSESIGNRKTFGNKSYGYVSSMSLSMVLRQIWYLPSTPLY